MSGVSLRSSVGFKIRKIHPGWTSRKFNSNPGSMYRDHCFEVGGAEGGPFARGLFKGDEIKEYWGGLDPVRGIEG